MSRTSNPTEPPDSDDDVLSEKELIELEKDFIDYLHTKRLTLIEVMKAKGVSTFREFRGIWDMSDDYD